MSKSFLKKRFPVAFDMEMTFHSHASKSHFHKKGWAPSLILKVRVFRSQKWPIIFILLGSSH